MPALRIDRGARSRTARALWLSAAAALLAAALFALAAAAAGAETKTRKPVTHTIVMEGTSFTPAALTITAGDSVRWLNKDFFPHTATAKDRFDSGIILAGQAWTHTPEKKGEVPYVCTLHPTMTGTLRVR